MAKDQKVWGISKCWKRTWCFILDDQYCGKGERHGQILCCGFKRCSLRDFPSPVAKDSALPVQRGPGLILGWGPRSLMPQRRLNIPHASINYFLRAPTHPCGLCSSPTWHPHPLHFPWLAGYRGKEKIPALERIFQSRQQACEGLVLSKEHSFLRWDSWGLNSRLLSTDKWSKVGRSVTL